MFVVLQDDKLKALVQKMGTNDWKHIANYIPVSLMVLFCVDCTLQGPSQWFTACLCPVQNHSEPQCQHRWFKVLDPELVKGPWTKEEDEKVRPCSIATVTIVFCTM